MRGWLAVSRPGFWTFRRALSSFTQESVRVRCGSAGLVSIDLFNISKHSPESPLLIHLPPLPASNDIKPLPGFLQQWPVASINYRWGSILPDDDFSPSLAWPTPIHDVSFAFSWLSENMLPPGLGRRPIYVYGSHFGAGLAVSLALTESQPHARFGVRGVLAYNGVYNWTMFLPDHRINRPVKRTKTVVMPPQPPRGSHLNTMSEHMPALFDTPANLFDTFASPSLFFHNPGLNVPPTFRMSAAESRMIDAIAQHDEEIDTEVQYPRRSHMVFPPRQSTLKIPEALLLHDSPPAVSPSGRRARSTRTMFKGNSFMTQAQELAELMQRSIDKIEFKERIKWDDEMDSWEEEARRRVSIMDVGEETTGQDLNRTGQRIASSWLGSRMQ